MSDHDAIESHEGQVKCRCGRWFVDSDAHAHHFGLEQARAALRGGDA